MIILDFSDVLRLLLAGGYSSDQAACLVSLCVKLLIWGGAAEA